MTSKLIKTILTLLTISLSNNLDAQKFYGKAIYLQKSKMQLGSWGARMSEAQKNQIKARLKNRLEKTYILTFNKQASKFVEDEKIDAISGATDSWGGYFSREISIEIPKKINLYRVKSFMASGFW